MCVTPASMSCTEQRRKELNRALCQFPGLVQFWVTRLDVGIAFVLVLVLVIVIVIVLVIGFSAFSITITASAEHEHENRSDGLLPICTLL